MSSSVSKTMLNGITFLVVDDEPDNVSVVVRLLTYMGAEVVAAENGQQGLETARAKRPNVILADLSMPSMSGWEMLYQAKQDPALKEIPMIALTAHAMAGDRTRVLAAGFIDYIAKPIDVPKFVPQLVDMLKDIPQTASFFAEKPKVEVP
jgi:CheY-like chemotaxis protein